MKKALIFISIFTLFAFAATESFARVGGGRSSGFRSYKSQPSRSQDSVTKTPQQQQTQPPLQQQARPSFFSSPLFKTLAGGLLIGGLLSLFMGHGMNFGTPGLLDILIIGGLLFFIYRAFSRRRANAGMQYAGTTMTSPGVEQPLAHDTAAAPVSGINEEYIKDLTRNTYKTLQDAWSQGDLKQVRHLITDRMYEYLSKQMDELRSAGLRNVVEIVHFQNVDVVEVSDEGDGKVVVVLLDVLMRDYTLDKNNTVVEGSKDTPVDAREYWAFKGKGLDWKLDDIRQMTG